MISKKTITTQILQPLSTQDSHPTVLYLVPQWWGAVKSAVRFGKVLQKQGWTVQFVLVKNHPFKSCEIFDQQLNKQNHSGWLLSCGGLNRHVSLHTKYYRP